MRPNGVVMDAPSLDENLGLGERVEDLAIEEFISEFPIEAFIVAILPRAAGLDIKRLYTQTLEPIPDDFSCKFAAVAPTE